MKTSLFIMERRNSVRLRKIPGSTFMTLDIKRIKAVCFDIDGTLSDTDDSFVRKVAKILSPAVFLFDSRDVLPLARKLVMLTEGPGNWFYGIADRIGLPPYSDMYSP